jgi:hypothetical protein
MKTLRRVIATILVCLALAAVAQSVTWLGKVVLGLPLYLDTIFVAAAAFALGLVPGLLVQFFAFWPMWPIFRVLLHRPDIVSPLVYQIGFWLCGSMVAVLCVIFRRLLPAPEPGEPRSRRLVLVCGGLLCLSVVMALVESVMGGVVETLGFALTHTPEPVGGPEIEMQGGLYLMGLSHLPVEILSRIPINLIDRPITVFGGYGVAIGLRALMRRLG